MQNIMDYLDWRGDLDFTQDGFNEVDNLIMSSLAYLEFDGMVPPPSMYKTVSLSGVADYTKKQGDGFTAFSHIPFFRQIPLLFYKAARSPRYGDIRLSNYINEIDYHRSEQFSAVVFSINPDLHFVAFRGTDDTIAGWKESFQMSFMDEVPAQKQAVAYLKSIFSRFPGRFYLGGHSKGGNLAVYAAVHAGKEATDRIITIYNNDGPGFQTGVIKNDGYQRIVGRIRTFLPKSSVVGLLLEHHEKYEVVASGNIGIMQHNAFSWEVKGPRFVYDKGISRSSIAMKNTVRAWLENLSLEQREEFVNILFDVIQASDAKTVGDLSKEKLAASIAMIKTFNHMDNRTRFHLMNTVVLFFKESGKSINRSIITEINALLVKKS